MGKLWTFDFGKVARLCSIEFLHLLLLASCLLLSLFFSIEISSAKLDFIVCHFEPRGQNLSGKRDAFNYIQIRLKNGWLSGLLFGLWLSLMHCVMAKDLWISLDEWSRKEWRKIRLLLSRILKNNILLWKKSLNETLFFGADAHHSKKGETFLHIFVPRYGWIIIVTLQTHWGKMRGFFVKSRVGSNKHPLLSLSLFPSWKSYSTVEHS